MADVSCNECGKLSDDVICRECYKDLQDQLGSAEDTIRDLQTEIDELKTDLKGKDV